jgi:hypothetical protein
VSGNYLLTVGSNTLNYTGQNFGFKPFARDLKVELTEKSRPISGSPGARFDLKVSNNGQVPVAGTLTIERDAQSNFSSATPADFLLTALGTRWEFAALPPGESREYSITLTYPAGLGVGTLFSHNVTLEPVAGDENPGDNQLTLLDTLVLVGRNEPQWAGGLQLYPNPAAERVQLTFDSPASETARWTLRNLMGQEIGTGTLDIRAGFNRHTLGLPNGADGVYRLEVSSPSGILRRTVIIAQE